MNRGHAAPAATQQRRMEMANHGKMADGDPTLITVKGVTLRIPKRKDAFLRTRDRGGMSAITITVDDHALDQLDRLEARTGSSRSALIRVGIEALEIAVMKGKK